MYGRAMLVPYDFVYGEVGECSGRIGLTRLPSVTQQIDQGIHPVLLKDLNQSK